MTHSMGVQAAEAGRWATEPWTHQGGLIRAADGRMVADTEWHLPDADRIVTCVNAAAGIPDPADLRRQRDELLAACRAAEESLAAAVGRLTLETFDHNPGVAAQHITNRTLGWICVVRKLRTAITHAERGTDGPTT